MRVAQAQPVPPWSAVVLAGGTGRRLGGVDKPALVVGGRTLLDRAVAACRGATEIVAVGPARPTSAAVRWTREKPPGGGPVAALAAGLTALGGSPAVVAVLAADLPLISPGLVERLVDQLADDGDGSVDAVAVVDGDGRVQPLVAAYRRKPLAAALGALGDPHGRALRDVLSRLKLGTLADDAAASDIDTPGDLARWQGDHWKDVAATGLAERVGGLRMEPWVTALCERLGVPLDDVDVDAILDLARDAAHSVERPAAPVTAFVAGYAAALRGGGATEVTAALNAAAELARDWADGDDSSDEAAAPTLE